MAEKEVLLLDVDGVLRNTMGKCIEIYKREIDPASTMTPLTIVKFDIEPFFPGLKAHNISAGKYFFNDNGEEVFGDAQPYDPAVGEQVRMLGELATICITTNQPRGYEKYTLNWLGEYGIPYDAIFFGKDKSQVARPGNIALDDYTKNLLGYQALGVTPVCYRQPWNSDWAGDAVKDLHEMLIYLIDRKQG